MDRKSCMVLVLLTVPILISAIMLAGFIILALPEEVSLRSFLDGSHTAGYSEDAIAVRDQVLADMEHDRENLERALASLPPGSPLPPNWRLEERLQEAWLETEMDLLRTFYQLWQGEAWHQERLEHEIAEWRADREEMDPKEAAAHFDPGEGESLMRQFEQYVLASSILDELETAIDLEVARYVPNLPFAHTLGLATPRSLAAELLACRAVLLAEDGQHDKAVATALRVHQFGDPETLLYAPRWLIDDTWRAAERALGAVAKGGKLDAVTRQQFLAHYEKRDDMDWFERRLCAMAIREWGDPVDPTLQRGQQMARETEVALEEARQLVEMLRSPLYESRDTFDEMLSRRWDALNDPSRIRRMASLTLNKFDSHLGSFHVMGVLAEGLCLQRQAFMRDVVATAFAIEDYAAKYGEYPETFEAIIPEFLPALPIDPVCGNPIVYFSLHGYKLRTHPLPLKANRDGSLTMVTESCDGSCPGHMCKPDVLWDPRRQRLLLLLDYESFRVSQ